MGITNDMMERFPFAQCGRDITTTHCYEVTDLYLYISFIILAKPNGMLFPELFHISRESTINL